MKPKYWVIIILIIIAGIVSWYYYLTSKSKLVSQCVTPALLEQIKNYPKPDRKGCPKGYFIQSLLCPGSPIWCEPEASNSSAPSSTPPSAGKIDYDACLKLKGETGINSEAAYCKINNQYYYAPVPAGATN